MSLNKYLDGYLSILPQEEYEAVLNLLKKESPEVFNHITYDQFRELVKQISEYRELSTVDDPQEDILDSAKHNKFFSSVYTDLSVMFSELRLVERAINNYKTLANSEIAQLEYEIELLRASIKDTETILYNADQSVSFSCAVGTSDWKETYNSNIQTMYLDRDGSALSDCTIIGNNAYIAEVTTLATPVTKYKAEIVNERTMGEDLSNHGIEKIVDGQMDSSWIHEVTIDKPISSTIYNYSEDGALCEIKLDLGYVMPLNNLTLTFDCTYAPDLVFISYADGKYIYASQKFVADTGAVSLIPPGTYSSNKFEIPLSFTKVNTQMLNILIRQPNYTVINDTPPPAEPETPSTPPVVPGSDKPVVKEYITYKVVKGDSLWKIANVRFKSLGVKWQDIAKLNGIKGPTTNIKNSDYMIFPGQILRIKEK